MDEPSSVENQVVPKLISIWKKYENATTKFVKFLTTKKKGKRRIFIFFHEINFIRVSNNSKYSSNISIKQVKSFKINF
jgi:hypothetical protein